MVEMEATKATSATVTESPAAQVEDPKKMSKNSSASWIFFSLSSLFGTPAKIHGYYEIKIFKVKSRFYKYVMCIRHNNTDLTRRQCIMLCLLLKVIKRLALRIFFHRVSRGQIAKN